MDHNNYLDAILRSSDSTIIEAVRFNYYDDLVDVLSSFSDPEMARFDCNVGWFPLIAQLHRKLKYIDPYYKIFQIKEKFGGLRYYFSPSELDGEADLAIKSSIMHDVTNAAENKSFSICEICSKQGARSSKHSWIRTVCSEHDS